MRRSLSLSRSMLSRSTLPRSLRRPTARRPRGFTLIELMVVMSCIAVLAALASSHFTHSIKRARGAEAIQTLGDLERALSAYYVRNDAYPGTDPSCTVTTGVPPAGCWQPPLTPLGKQPMPPSPVPTGWDKIDYTGDGAFRYRYTFYSSAVNGTRLNEIVLVARADTDGDGLYATYTRTLVDGFRADQTDIEEP